jgi:hypothetical protein
MRLIKESLRNSHDVSTIMLDGSKYDILRKRSGRTTRRISMKSPEPNMQNITDEVAARTARLSTLCGVRLKSLKKAQSFTPGLT